MKKYILLIICALFLLPTLDAQIIFRTAPHPQFRKRALPVYRTRHLPNFKPTINISFGYGIPNLDKYELPGFWDYYHTSVVQKGPIYGSIDYQFMRNMSLGITWSYGKVSADYYNYNNDAFAFTGNLKNTSLMLNIVRYIPSRNEKIEPYFKTAIGLNLWSQDFLDPSGKKVVIADDPTELTYQVGIGTILMLSKQAGFFIEAGYGKYIFSGGLTFKF